VLVGQRGWEAEDVFARLDAAPRDRGEVIELGQCDDAALAAWIDHARALLLPSKVEGFGLPMIEALARGTPVIAADLPVYREIAGAIPLLLDPEDNSAWLAAVQAYLGDSAERARQMDALATFNPPRWPAHMAQVRKWLKAL
jgi:glycosyltransferase involved in cell wall biosynthesis